MSKNEQRNYFSSIFYTVIKITFSNVIGQLLEIAKKKPKIGLMNFSLFLALEALQDKVQIFCRTYQMIYSMQTELEKALLHHM